MSEVLFTLVMQIYAFVLATSLVIPAHTANIQWKSYRNERWGFCSEVPQDWRMGEGINGAGGRFDVPGSGGTSSIAVGALPNQCVDTHERYGPRCDRRQTLQEIDTGDLQQLKDQGVKALRVIALRTESFRGMDALFTRRSYREKGSAVTEQVLRFLANGNVYAIEFQCRPRDVAECEAVFRHIAATLKLRCE